MKIIKRDLKKAVKTKEMKYHLSAIELEECVDMFFDLIEDTLNNEEDVVFSGFGKFTVKQIAPYGMYDMFKKMNIIVHPKKNVKFVASQKLRNEIN